MRLLTPFVYVRAVVECWRRWRYVASLPPSDARGGGEGNIRRNLEEPIAGGPASLSLVADGDPCRPAPRAPAATDNAFFSENDRGGAKRGRLGSD